MRRFHFALLALALLVAQPLVAATYYVGSCHSKAFSTISAAVAAVPAGSIIEVCPGTYAEQVVIDEALTLEAIPNSNGWVVISDSGVTLTTTTSISIGPVAPQVWVTAGPVKLINITVTQQTTTPPPAEVGVFYASGSSGLVEGTAISGNSNYIGIVAENGAGATQSVTIENNYLSGQLSGVFVDSNQETSSLTATVKNNYISITGGGVALQSLDNAQGSISDNFVSFLTPGEGMGVWAGAQQVSISGNWISNCNIGINSEASGASVTSNRILNCITGIFIGTNDATIKTNSIVGTSGAIEFDCTTGNTVTGNIINKTGTALDRVPSGFTGSNTFYNMNNKITGGCS
ncbi:MAG: hypothetical protein ABSG08_17950 [Terriglobales bacterium]|jgi:nitrous oxidase accessory protein NosD